MSDHQDIIKKYEEQIKDIQKQVDILQNPNAKEDDFKFDFSFESLENLSKSLKDIMEKANFKPNSDSSKT
jgi:hypothetical protein